MVQLQIWQVSLTYFIIQKNCFCREEICFHLHNFVTNLILSRFARFLKSDFVQITEEEKLIGKGSVWHIILVRFWNSLPFIHGRQILT